jgi:hypothetical protein
MNRRTTAHLSGRLMARLHLACMFPNMILTQPAAAKLAARLFYQAGVVELLRESRITVRFAFTHR